ncbi:integrase core domain-containing protein [Winogradskyella rapida]|uniref:Integrase core domain-containing protein n=1 Tax=Winogradskyella rapida TaxID=549701 RepID=A0ABW3KKW0_9FLAO
MNVSRTEQNHCYENAKVKRVNGILKDEFYLDQTFDSVAQTNRAENVIKLYNEIRLYLSLDYKTGYMVYKLSA